MSKLYRKNPKDRRGKWSDVFKSLGLVVFLYMAFRWIVWEPFVIPSGSMETTLLVQDYVLVRKWSYGVRIPFTETWAIGPSVPKRGDIVVFKSKDESGHFIVKRVIGLPGEKVSINNQGFIHINGSAFGYVQESASESDMVVFRENNGVKSYQVQFFREMQQEPYEFKVPEGQIFMMGDNRNQSNDSRFWGALPLERIMGKLTTIWMSCRESESYSSFLCSPQDFRMERLFKSVE